MQLGKKLEQKLIQFFEVAIYFRSRPAIRSKNKQPFSQGTQAQNRTPQRQNIGICMGIYREFDEIGKMYINSHLSVHTL